MLFSRFDQNCHNTILFQHINQKLWDKMQRVINRNARSFILVRHFAYCFKFWKVKIVHQRKCRKNTELQQKDLFYQTWVPPTPFTKRPTLITSFPVHELKFPQVFIIIISLSFPVFSAILHVNKSVRKFRQFFKGNRKRCESIKTTRDSIVNKKVC